MLGKNVFMDIGRWQKCYGKILNISDITISIYSLEDDSMVEEHGRITEVLYVS